MNRNIAKNTCYLILVLSYTGSLLFYWRYFIVTSWIPLVLSGLTYVLGYVSIRIIRKKYSPAIALKGSLLNLLRYFYFTFIVVVLCFGIFIPTNTMPVYFTVYIVVLILLLMGESPEPKIPNKNSHQHN